MSKSITFESEELRRDKDNNLVPTKVILVETLHEIDGTVQSTVRDATEEEAKFHLSKKDKK